MNSLQIGIDYLTLNGLWPTDFIEAVAAGGGKALSLQPVLPASAPAGSRPFHIFDDINLRRDIVASLDANGISVSLMEGVGSVEPGQSVERHRGTLNKLAELGITRFMTFSFDPDVERTINETALLMEIAAEYGMSAVMENHPGLGEVKTIAGIQDFVRRIDKPNLKLMIDAIHAAYQHEVDLVATLEPSLIGYVQLCDGPRLMPQDLNVYARFARHERLLPGEGELPLAQMFSNVAGDTPISCEMPNDALRKSCGSDAAYVRHVLAAAKRALKPKTTAESSDIMVST
jgi:sugar phosphate isomerase/epimerase